MIMCMAKKSALARCFMPPSYLVGHTSPGGRRVMHHHHHIGGYTTHTPTHTHAHTRPPDSRNHILWGSLVVHYHSTSKSMVSRNRLRHPKAGVVPRCWFGGSALDDHVDFVARSSLSSIRRKHEKNECATSHPFRGCFRKVPTNRATLCVFVIFGGVMIKR